MNDQHALKMEAGTFRMPGLGLSGLGHPTLSLWLKKV